jgi:hypothetical protein
MSLLSDSEKASIFADFNTAMNTFLRPLTVYQSPQTTVIITDPNFNPLDGNYNENSEQIENVPIYTTINGRILYDKNQEWTDISPNGSAKDGQLKISDQLSVRAVRIKVDYSGYSLLSTTKKIELDGFLFNLESEPRPHGPFGTGYWTFYFSRSL